MTVQILESGKYKTDEIPDNWLLLKFNEKSSRFKTAALISPYYCVSNMNDCQIKTKEETNEEISQG